MALIAAATAGVVAYLTGGNSGERSSAATQTTSGSSTQAGRADVIALIPTSLRATCVKQPVADIGAVQTAVCVEPAGATGFSPDRWQVSTFQSGAAVRAAYRAELRRHGITPNQGKCTSLSWGGEGAWSHGPGKPGGRRLCYFDGDDAVVVWTHERLGQANHRDVLASAREGGSDHARLIGWWAHAHHLIGKLE